MLRRYFYYYRKFGWQGIRILRLLNNKGASLLEIKMKNFLFPVFLRQHTSDIIAFEHIFTESQYKIHFNFNPKYIFDLGANIGLASVYFKNRFPDATIFAVEPDVSNFEMLLKNTKLYNNIQCLKYAIWYKHATLELFDPGEGHWSFVTKENDSVAQNTVEAKTIDLLMAELNVPHIDILKIDIEGAEKYIFEDGFDKWLPKVRCIIIELHDRNIEGCSKAFFKALSGYDFKLRLRHENLICDL